MSDQEMEGWRKAWSNSDETQAAPKKHDVIVAVRRYRLRSGLNLAGNVAVGLLFISGSLLVARHMRSREIILWAVAVWIATLIALFLSLEGWVKERIKPTETVADYAAFYRRKALIDEWKARKGATLLLVLFCISCAWLTTDVLRHRIGQGRYAMAVGLSIAVSAVWSYALLRMWRRAKAILRHMPIDELWSDGSDQD